MKNSDPRALLLLGRRIERLIVGSIILVALCFVEAYVSTVNHQLIGDTKLIVISAVQDKIQKSQDDLNELFASKDEPPSAPKYQPTEARQKLVARTREQLGLPPPSPPKTVESQPKPRSYSQTLDDLVREVEIKNNSRLENKNEIITNSRTPQEILKALQQQKEMLEKTSANVWGIQSPHIFHFQYAGEEYQIPFDFLSYALESMLAPLIIVWLGAFYMTRQRELLMIVKLNDYKLAFPHILNFLPVAFEYSSKNTYEYNPTYNLDREKKSAQKFEKFNQYIQASLRVSVILLFALPLFVGYSYSLYQIGEAGANGKLHTLGVFLAFVMFSQIFFLSMQDWLVLKKKYFYE